MRFSVDSVETIHIGADSEDSDLHARIEEALQCAAAVNSDPQWRDDAEGANDAGEKDEAPRKLPPQEGNYSFKEAKIPSRKLKQEEASSTQGSKN